MKSDLRESRQTIQESLGFSQAMKRMFLSLICEAKHSQESHGETNATLDQHLTRFVETQTFLLYGRREVLLNEDFLTIHLQVVLGLYSRHYALLVGKVVEFDEHQSRSVTPLWAEASVRSVDFKVAFHSVQLKQL